MAVNPVPEGYHTVAPYILTEDPDRLVEFLKAAFGAVEHQRVPGRDGSTGHADVTIGDSHVMMGKAQKALPAFSCMLHVYLPDIDAAYARALSAGAVSVQEPTNMYYGDRTAGVRDVSGNTWWLASRQENLTAAKLAERLNAGGKQLPEAQSAH